MVSDSLVGPNRLIWVSRVLISFTFRLEEAGGRGKKKKGEVKILLAIRRPPRGSGLVTIKMITSSSASQLGSQFSDQEKETTPHCLYMSDSQYLG